MVMNLNTIIIGNFKFHLQVKIIDQKNVAV